MVVRRWIGVFASALLGLGLAAPAFAQIGAAALTGRIADQDGGALPGATVTVVSTATGLSRTVAAGTRWQVRRSSADARHLQAARRVERLPAAGVKASASPPAIPSRSNCDSR